MNVTNLLKERALIEKELLRQLSGGNPTALRELVQLYSPVLCRFAGKFVPDSSLARDIVQETFIKLWQYKGSFENFSGLKSFLYTVTRNGCLNWQRGREREANKCLRSAQHNILETESVYDEMVRSEYLARIRQVILKMPAKMQEVFLLSFEEGLSIDEISQRLQISTKTVRNQKYKSLVILRQTVGSAGLSLFWLLSCLLK